MDLSAFVLPLLLVAFMYLLVIRPQQQERAAHEALVKSLAKDDEIVVTSGLHGKVVGVGERTLTLEIAKNVRVTIDKDSVQRKIGAETAA